MTDSPVHGSYVHAFFRALHQKFFPKGTYKACHWNILCDSWIHINLGGVQRNAAIGKCISWRGTITLIERALQAYVPHLLDLILQVQLLFVLSLEFMNRRLLLSLKLLIIFTFSVFEIISLPLAIIHHFWKLEVEVTLLRSSLMRHKNFLFGQTQFLLFQHEVRGLVLQIEHQKLVWDTLRGRCAAFFLRQSRIPCQLLILTE